MADHHVGAGDFNYDAQLIPPFLAGVGIDEERWKAAFTPDPDEPKREEIKDPLHSRTVRKYHV
jgi:hypothetical protein